MPALHRRIVREPLGEYALSRWTHPSGTVSIQVGFIRRKVRYEKAFNTLEYGSERAALKAARAWRDQMLGSIPGFSAREYVSQRRTNNSSKRAGVQRIRVALHKPGQPPRFYEAWVAVSLKGRPPKKTRSFSVKKYGEQQAYRLAVAARKAFEAQANGAMLPHVPAPFKRLSLRAAAH
jgi:hypothetical protein